MYSDAYIVIKGTIDLLNPAANENDKAQENVAFKNNYLLVQRHCNLFQGTFKRS